MLVPGRDPKSEGENMAIGPVQLIVLGFNHPEFHGEIIAELEKLRASDTVRGIDALAVYKDAGGQRRAGAPLRCSRPRAATRDAGGQPEVGHLKNLSGDEAIEVGTAIGALIGL